MLWYILDSSVIPLYSRFVMLYIIALGVLWMLVIQGRPLDDQYIVQKSAAEFIDGNYSSMEHGQYLYRSTHQLGIVFIFECIYRIVGPENYQAIMILNCVLANARYVTL